MASGKATVMMEMETVRTEMVMELEKESCIQHCNSNYENLD
jgi:hypothetical protein